MRVHSEKKLMELVKLRSTGHSIQEIVEKLDMPKTTVWHYIQNVKVLPQYQPSLKSKRGGSSKRKARNERIAEEKSAELLEGPDREILTALAMLYWAEGSKGSPEFINSDGRMISLYLHILRDVLEISNDSLNITIRIFTGMNKKECVQYWARVTSISPDRFTIRVNDGGTRGRTRYGMCRVGVRKGGHFLKMMHALIDQSYRRITDL